MGTTEVQMERLFRRLIWGNVGQVIDELEVYLAAWPNQQTHEKLTVIREEYELMEHYWQQGTEDPQREQVYQGLLQRLYVLCSNIAIYRHMNASAFLHGLYTQARAARRWSLDAVRSEMENFVTEVAMLELEPANKREEKRVPLYEAHQRAQNQLFNFVVTSNIWSDHVASQMEAILLAPTVDSNDQQLLTSAITLSLMNRFDMAKFRTLVNVYRQTTDEKVRQRALVGWVLGIDDDFLTVYPEQRELMGQLLKSKRVCDELAELQVQLVLTLNAERDTKTMTDEIMPDLIKGSQMRMTDHGLEETEDDALEDVLHPEASEERMEKLEASFQRMQNMQQQGSDLFFSGFSQMKRMPFFYDMSNWMVPFYWEHPDIHQFVAHLGENRFLEDIIFRLPISDSDRYSFVVAFQQVVSSIPENMLKLLREGEAKFAMGEISDEEQQQPAYIRRSYLMDLYRFFRLFPNRASLCNPFDTSKQELGMCLFFGSSLFAATPLEERKREIVSMLLKRKLEKSADKLLETFPKEMRDVQYYLWLKDYDKVLELDADNERAMLGVAREKFDGGAYADACELYDKLMLLVPGKTSYMLGKAICLSRMEEYEDALKLLYQLNYEQPENDKVTRALAWTLVGCDRLEQAAKLYVQLTGNEQPLAEDYENQGYCLWLQGRIADAAASFRRYKELAGLSDDDFWMGERRLLAQHGITEIDVNMMVALVLHNA